MRLICIFLAFSLTVQTFAGQQELAKQRMIRDLDFILSTFEIKYAPLEWKKQQIGFDLYTSFAEAKKKINQLTAPTTKDFQQILRQLLNQAADYHVGAKFYSTESAGLPLTIQSACDPFSDGIRRYFVTYIDRAELPYEDYPILVGDEVLAWEGVPIDVVVDQLRKDEFGQTNTFETNQALAELVLTHREGSFGIVVPMGEVELTFKRTDWTEPFTCLLEWDYYPEQIKDFSRLSAATIEEPQISFKQWQEYPLESLKCSRLFQKLMVSSYWRCSSADVNNPYKLGVQESFIPSLGKKIWEADEESAFTAYIFKTPSQQKIGYVRIAHYIGDEEEVEKFCELIRRFEQTTDALVIDQLNNPGGLFMYAYALLSTFAKEPLVVPKHQMTLTQEEIYMSASMLPMLESLKDEDEMQSCLGEAFGGYPVSVGCVYKMKDFLRGIVRQWNKGNLCTEPLYLFGIDHIQPHPDAVYTKPLLVLINELDISCGDFFPAILQDNKRAVILGTRTAGAGGYVLSTEYPNHMGIIHFDLTGSLAERAITGDPIENLGVEPDIAHTWTVDDRRYHYRDYVNKILETLDLMLLSDLSSST